MHPGTGGPIGVLHSFLKARAFSGWRPADDFRIDIPVVDARLSKRHIPRKWEAVEKTSASHTWKTPQTFPTLLLGAKLAGKGAGQDILSILSY
jgi:hypothetical protein